MKQETLNAKAKVVEEVVAQFEANPVVLVVGVEGLDALATTTLRRSLHEKGAALSVVRNNVLKRASDAVGFSSLDSLYANSTAIVLSQDISGATKGIVDFAKKTPKFVIKGGYLDKKPLTVEEITTLAKLPDKNGMISMLLSCLEAPIRSFAVVVKAIAEKDAAPAESQA